MKNKSSISRVIFSILFFIQQISFAASKNNLNEVNNPDASNATFNEGYKSNNSIFSAPELVLGRVFGVEGYGGDISYHSLDLSEHSPAHAALRSALFPGWGQQFNRHYVKGYLVSGSFIATALGSILLYNSAVKNFDDYNSKGVKNDGLYDDYKTQRSQAFILGTLATLIWGYSVVDAYQNGYKAVWSQDQSIQLCLNNESTEVVYSRKFGFSEKR